MGSVSHSSHPHALGSESAKQATAYEEARQKLYIDISQTFRLWPAIPLGYRADVNLVTVLQLTSDRSGRDKTAEQATNTSPFTENGAVKPATTLATQPGKYWIKSQTDLYQTTEFAKFASLLGLLPLLVSLWHMLATYCCVLGAIVFAPFSQAWQHYTDREVEHRAKVRSSPAFGPNFGGDRTAEGRARERQLDIWELEAKYLNGGLHDASKMEGLKMNIKTSLKMDSGRQQPGGASQGASLEWMKMEKSRP